MAKKSGSDGVNHIWIHLELFETYRFNGFSPTIWMGFAKIALVNIYMLQTFKTGSHFFHNEPNFMLKWFLGPSAMVKVP